MFSLFRIHLKTTDVVSASQWYVENLKAKLIQDYEGRGNHNILLDVDGIEIIVTQPPDATSLPVAPAEPHIGLEHFGLFTDDLGGLLSEMKGRGVEIIELSPPEREGEYAFVRAPDGVRLELVQR